MTNKASKKTPIGDTLKKIRKNKNYTQKFVTEGVIGQSAYSKIERGFIEPSISKFQNILRRLDMEEEEFRYLMGQELSEREELIQSFFLQNYNDQTILEGIKARVKDYLVENNDYLLQDIFYICEALLLIIKDRDYKKAATFANKVWKRLEKYDQWYLMEFRLINSILFIFPVESVLEIADRMNSQLKAFNSRESRVILNNLQINISLVLIRNGAYDSALSHLNELSQRFREERNYYLLAIVYMRKGIALSLLNNPEAEIFLEKSLRLVEAFDEKDLELAFLDEIKHYTTGED